MRYTIIPKEISSKTIFNNKYSFSPAQYKEVYCQNQNFLYVKDFLDRKLNRRDLGVEIGSTNYIDQSNKYFFRAKGLQSHTYTPVIDGESVVPMNPKVFIDQNLKRGDLIISKDSNIGECVILDKDYPEWMLSGALYKLPITKNKYYLLAFIKHDYFREQLEIMVPKSATIRHAKKMFLDCKIPIPSNNQDAIIDYVEALVKSVIKKEVAIKEKENTIHEIIHKELINNQKLIQFHYEYPNIKELLQKNRLDAGYYCEKYKYNQYLIKNYFGGCRNIYDWGYSIGRGQNLQVTAIGKSIYSESYYQNFYKLVRPLNLSYYGTVDKYEYLGNKRDLNTLKEGDILFSAEGSIGKCMMVTDANEKIITNIHGIILNKDNHNKLESGYVACFLRYLRIIGTLDYISVGGQGGSLAMQYWDDILIPVFPQNVIETISRIYHNPISISTQELTIDNFSEVDDQFITQCGIIELDKSLKQIKRRIDNVLDQIIKNQEVEITFDF